MLRNLLATEPHTEIVKATQIIEPTKTAEPMTLHHLHEMNCAISKLVVEMARAWTIDGEPIDAFLWVPAPHTTVPFDKYTYLGFTGLFNMIDWPALALPLNMYVDRAVDASVEVTPFNRLDASIQSLYDPDTFHGLPLRVQLIWRRFEDEKLLLLAEEVHNLIKAVD